MQISSNDPQTKALNDLIKLALDKGSLIDGAFHYSTYPFKIAFHISSPVGSYMFLYCELHLPTGVSDQVFKAYFIEVERSWRIISFKQGQWVDALSSLLKEIDSESFARIDDAHYFQKP